MTNLQSSMAQFPPVAVDACPLCGSAELRAESHIIPAFVFDYLRESSATGFMRFGPAPNLRVQDGFKQRLLCDKCEGILSAWERQTATSLFRPYHADTSAVMSYGPWLAKFCASVCWRVLYLFQRLGLKSCSVEQDVLVGQALNAWRGLMHGQVADPGTFELHLVPVNVMVSATGSIWPPNINRYFARAIEMDVASTPSSAFVYAKLCKLILVGFIQMKHPQEWIGTRVDLQQGVVKPEGRGLPTNFGLYLADRARRMADLNAQISAKQKGKIWDAAVAKVDRAANSDSLKAMEHDVAMFRWLAYDDDPERNV